MTGKTSSVPPKTPISTCFCNGSLFCCNYIHTPLFPTHLFFWSGSAPAVEPRTRALAYLPWLPLIHYMCIRIHLFSFLLILSHNPFSRSKNQTKPTYYAVCSLRPLISPCFPSPCRGSFFLSNKPEMIEHLRPN